MLLALPRRGSAVSLALTLATLLVVPIVGSPETRAGRAKPGEADDALKDWIDGPVRYIALPEEVRQFRALDGDPSRAMFVERFWLRRDPDPATLVNEYRTLFWERVKAANDTILDSPRPGWMTDRGKIYILYGPPHEIEGYVDLETDAGPTASRGLIRWIYERPGGRLDMDAIVVVPFVRDVTGEYRISYDPKLASVFLDEVGIRTKEQQRFDDLMIQLGGYSRESELSVMLDLGKIQEVPPAEKVLLEKVDTVEAYRSSPLSVQLDRFETPGGRDTRVAVTAWLPEADPDETFPAMLARFRPRQGGDERILGEGAFKFVSDGAGGLLAQGRLDLDQGTWDVFVVAARPYTAETAVWRGTVRSLPRRADDDALRLSDVVVAGAIAPVEVAALQSWEEPFHLGPYRVVPLGGRTLTPGDAVELLYEIYGGVAPFRVSYRLEGEEEDGSWVALGAPSSRRDATPVQAWQLPTGDGWPLGRYRVRVTVEDAGGTVAEATVPFTLEPSESSDTPDVADQRRPSRVGE